MSKDSSGEITALLLAAKSGQPGALDRLFSLVYDELRKIAKNRIGTGGYWTTEPTTLVNEAYVRLMKRENASWEDRHHFFWAAARAMRDILVERARRRDPIRNKPDQRTIQLREDMAIAPDPPDLIDLNEALIKLEAAHPLPAKVVSLQFFAGLNRDQIAEVLDLSPATIWREWSFARVWLRNQLDGETNENGKKGE